MSQKTSSLIHKPKASQVSARQAKVSSVKPVTDNSVTDYAASVTPVSSGAGHSFSQLSIVPSQVQTKLTVGEANDKYEQEADSIADKVMSMNLSPGEGSDAPATNGESNPTKSNISGVNQSPTASQQAPGIQNKPLSITPWVQRQTETQDEEESVQAKSLIQRQTENEEEEETLQAKPEIQRQTETQDEEESVQAKSLIQRQSEKEEEEEPLQAKPQIQPQTETQDEEESLQAKLLIQRQTENEEEEETLQAKSQTQRETGFEPDEENEDGKDPLQTRSTNKTTNKAPSVSSDLEGRLNRSQGGGQPLSESSRGFFEPRFGHDFSQVRIHADGEASQASRSLNAQAFTRGNDIYFGAGRFQPETKPGRQLLAHELTHTIQQTGSRPLSANTQSLNRKPLMGKTQAFNPPVISSVSSLPRAKQQAVIARKADTGFAAQVSSDVISSPVAESVSGPVFTDPVKTQTNNTSDRSSDISSADKDTTNTAAIETAADASANQAQTETEEKTAHNSSTQTTPEPVSSLSPQDSQANQLQTGEATATQTDQAVKQNETASETSTETSLPESADPGTLLGVVTQVPATRALDSFNQVQAESQAALERETATVQTDLSKIKAPTGITASRPQQKKKQEDQTPSNAADFNSEQTGKGSDPNSAMRKPTRVDAQPDFSQTDRALRAAKSADGADPGSAISALNAINLPTQKVPGKLGPRPVVDLSGEANPQQADAFQSESAQQVSKAGDESRKQSQQDFGEKAIAPAPDDTVLEAKQGLQNATSSGEALAEAQAVPEEVRGDIDQTMGATLAPALEQEKSNYQSAQAEFDTGKGQAETEAEAERQSMEQATQEEQLAARADASKQVNQQRKEWQDEIDKVDKDFADKSSQATKTEKEKIQSRDQQGRNEAEGHFEQAEKDAEKKKKDAERDAAKEKADAKAKGENEGFFSRIGSAIGDFVDSVKEAVSDIFDALKEAVSFIFDKAKKLALAAIDLARNAIVGLIKGLGVLLKGFVSVAFAAFPGIAERINSKIDGVVESTTKAINDAAESLKKGVSALLDGLASVINGLLSVVQAAYNFALGAMSLIVRGEFDKLGSYIVQSALKLIGATLGGLMSALGISEEDVQKIIADPVKFLGNFVGAIKQGLNNFVGNIVQHLTSGLLGWLFGAFSSAGIQLPTSFSLGSIFSFIAQILGVTYDALRTQLVKMLGSNGEAMVSALEKGFAFVSDFITRGPIVLWERVKDALSNIKELLFKPVIEWLRNTIIVKAITKLVAFFNPVGAIVQAIQAIYNVAMFFKERWEQIKSFAQSVFSSVKNIAAGQIASAAGFIEQSLAKAIPIMISFLARLLGLGGIVDKVKGVIKKIKKPIDKAVDKVLGWLVKVARKIWAGIKRVAGKLLPKEKKPKTQKERNRQVKEGLAFLHREETKVDDDKDKKLTFEQAQAAAKKTKKQFPVFGSIKVVDGGTRWDYLYSASAKSTVLSKMGQEDSDVPTTNVTHKTQDGKASVVTAAPLSIKEGNTSGSSASAKPPGWNIATWINSNTKDATGTTTTKKRKRTVPWNRVHLLSEKLHGPGNETWNLTPTTQSPNSSLSVKENKVHDEIKDGSTYYKLYKTTVEYNHPDTTQTHNDAGDWNTNEFPSRITLHVQKEGETSPKEILDVKDLPTPDPADLTFKVDHVKDGIRQIKNFFLTTEPEKRPMWGKYSPNLNLNRKIRNDEKRNLVTKELETYYNDNK